MRSALPSPRFRCAVDRDFWRGVTAALTAAAPDWTPSYAQDNPRQAMLHAASSPDSPEERFILYGGAAGGGKSRAIREDARRFCLTHAGVTVGLFRRTYPELRDTHELKLADEWPTDGSWRLKRTDHRVEFPGTGSRIIMGHCQYDADVAKYLGTEYDRLYFDELTTFSAHIFDRLVSRLRSTRPGMVTKAICATNPGGVGHNWVRERWIDRTWDKDLGAYRFIPASLADNPHINHAEYVANLGPLPEATLRAWLEGRWDTFEGQFFRAWDPVLHVCQPGPVAGELVRAVDYGSTAPFCCLWAAVDRSQSPPVVTVYREHYQAGWTLAENVAEVLRLSEGEAYRSTVMDPACWGRESDGNSIAYQAERLGLPAFPAQNQRLAGWGVVNQALKGQGFALRIFETCGNLVRTLPALTHDKRMVEDCAPGEDHAPDALRYLLMEVASTAPAPLRLAGYA